MRAKEFLKDMAGSITLEPGILLHTLSIGIMVGPAIQTNLLLWKVFSTTTISYFKQ